MAAQTSTSVDTFEFGTITTTSITIHTKNGLVSKVHSRAEYNEEAEALGLKDYKSPYMSNDRVFNFVDHLEGEKPLHLHSNTPDDWSL